MRRVLLAGLAALALAGCADGGAGSSDTLGAQSSPTDAVQGPAAQPTDAATTAPGATCTKQPATAAAPPGSTTNLKVEPKVKKPSTPPPCDLQVRDLVVGTGTEAKSGSTVVAKYEGVLYATGTTFDASWKQGASNTFSYKLGAGMVIPGFDMGTVGMKVGGRREIVIPSKDGYGEQGSPPVIPANADLIFVIDLVKVT